jgi:DnaJ-class molecular chaperone
LSDLLRRRQQGPRKGKSVLQLLEITLVEAYNGASRKMKVTRSRLCKECNGKGGKEDSVAECTVCSGTGRVTRLMRMGFMTTQTITQCEECKGRGKIIKDKCKKCNGNMVVEEEKVLELDIAKGTPEGHRFIFKGDADEYVTFIFKLAWN